MMPSRPPPLRILQVSKLYYPWIGGVESVVRWIAEGLQDRLDMKVLVCQPCGRTVDERVSGVSIRRAGSIGMMFSMPVSPGFLFQFHRLASDRDILHLHLPFPMADICHFLTRPPAKLVLWWHSDIVRQKSHRIVQALSRRGSPRTCPRIPADARSTRYAWGLRR